MAESSELSTGTNNNLEELDAAAEPDCGEVISAAVGGLLILVRGRRLWMRRGDSRVHLKRISGALRRGHMMYQGTDG
jgi:hypothetical protein